MYEVIYKLKIKAAAGVESAKQELDARKNCRITLQVPGIKGESVCLSMTDELIAQVNSIKTIYPNVSKKNKAKVPRIQIFSALLGETYLATFWHPQ